MNFQRWWVKICRFWLYGTYGWLALSEADRAKVWGTDTTSSRGKRSAYCRQIVSNSPILPPILQLFATLLDRNLRPLVVIIRRMTPKVFANAKYAAKKATLHGYICMDRYLLNINPSNNRMKLFRIITIIIFITCNHRCQCFLV